MKGYMQSMKGRREAEGRRPNEAEQVGEGEAAKFVPATVSRWNNGEDAEESEKGPIRLTQHEYDSPFVNRNAGIWGLATQRWAARGTRNARKKSLAGWRCLKGRNGRRQLHGQRERECRCSWMCCSLNLVVGGIHRVRFCYIQRGRLEGTQMRRKVGGEWAAACMMGECF